MFKSVGRSADAANTSVCATGAISGTEKLPRNCHALDIRLEGNTKAFRGHMQPITWRWVSRSIFKLALIVFVSGWAPLVLLDPIGWVFPKLNEDYTLGAWAMALLVGLAAPCTLFAIILVAYGVWRRWTGADLPPVKLNLDSTEPEYQE